MRQCIGFGEFEGTCENPADANDAGYWCRRCEPIRVEHIGRQLREIHDDLVARAREAADRGG